MKWYSITIKNRESYTQWIAVGAEGKEYSGRWQWADPLKEEEIEMLLSLLVSKTEELNIEEEEPFL